MLKLQPMFSHGLFVRLAWAAVGEAAMTLFAVLFLNGPLMVGTILITVVWMALVVWATTPGSHTRNPWRWLGIQGSRRWILLQQVAAMIAVGVVLWLILILPLQWLLWNSDNFGEVPWNRQVVRRYIETDGHQIGFALEFHTAKTAVQGINISVNLVPSDDDVTVDYWYGPPNNTVIPPYEERERPGVESADLEGPDYSIRMGDWPITPTRSLYFGFQGTKALPVLRDCYFLTILDSPDDDKVHRCVRPKER